MRKRPFAKARPRHTPGTMNATERAYAGLLEEEKQAGRIADYAFEPEALRLAPRTTFTPDFRVLTDDGLVEFHEVKACKKSGAFLVEDDAMVKIKAAAVIHWCYLFKLCGKLPASIGGGWKFQELPSA